LGVGRRVGAERPLLSMQLDDVSPAASSAIGRAVGGPNSMRS